MKSYKLPDGRVFSEVEMVSYPPSENFKHGYYRVAPVYPLGSAPDPLPIPEFFCASLVVEIKDSGAKPLKYRKKPVVIEAVQWSNKQIVCPPGPEWFVEAEMSGKIQLHGTSLSIHTLEGVMEASLGDWIIRGVMGEIYPCKPDVFAATYEAV